MHSNRKARLYIETDQYYKRNHQNKKLPAPDEATRFPSNT
jgi:hypothetical protein